MYFNVYNMYYNFKTDLLDVKASLPEQGLGTPTFNKSLL